MNNNPFASYAASSSSSCSTNNNNVAKNIRGGGGDGWLTTSKSASDIKKSKEAATEARRAKNRRGKPSAAAKKGGKKQTKIDMGKKKKKKRGCDSSSSEESFQDYSEEEDDDNFIVEDDDDEEEVINSEEDAADWDEDMEEDSDESDFGGGGKSKKKGKKKKTALPRSARAAKRTNNKSTWQQLPTNMKNDDIEESPMPPKNNGRKKRAAAGKKKNMKESPLKSDEDLSDEDDIYAPDPDYGQKKGNKVDQSIDLSDDDSDATTVEDGSSPDARQPAKKKAKKSPYFSNNDNGEEKKEDEEEDENVLNHAKKGGNKKQQMRAILDDSDSDEDMIGVKTKSAGGMNDNLSDLDDTPGKPRNSKTSSFNDDDFMGDDEFHAVKEAMNESQEDEGRKLKKLKKKKSKNRGGGSSSLEQLDNAAPVYKDDIEELKDSDDDNDGEDDDEMEVYEVVDEGQETATQVLTEANKLSAKIVRIVSGWCSGGGTTNSKDNKSGSGNIKGLILGDDGALNLGHGASVVKVGEGDDMWISDETMKEILPNVKLAEYQLLGVNWMALLNRSMFGKVKSGKKGGVVNGILADEMGLGKTVQTIAFLAWLNHQRKSAVINVDDEEPSSSNARRPHLIAVPASVLSNWMNEFKKFAPDMVVVKYYGNQTEREEIRQEMEHNHLVYSPKEQKFVNGGAPLDVVLTTFSYFSSDSNKLDRTFLKKFDFDYLVVDEGHTLKNSKGLRYKNMNKFKTSHRLLLTGTPVQNSPKELMALLCFLMPLFDTKTKRKKGYAEDDDDNDGGERMLEYFVQLEGGAGDDETAYRKLKQLFAPFVLRRKKDDVLGQILPPKNRKIDIVPMDDSTRSSYDSILADHIKARNERATGATSAAAQQHLFTNLRKAANHPLLLRKRYQSEKEKDTLARLALSYHYFGNDASCTLQIVRDELDKMSDYEIHEAAMTMIDESPARRKYLEKYTLMESDLFCSPKFVRLRSLLPELIGKGHRILLFSQWTKILDLIEHLMHSLSLTFLRLDGQTDVRGRQDLIDTFNKDDKIPIFLLSTRAGGMGLNLTAADVCILHDLDFNPFNDRQAEDRCHRIGQKKPVTVIKMVTEGTIDEDIYRMQERKESMNEAIMEKGGGKKKSKDNEEIAKMATAALERFEKSPVRPPTSTSSTKAPVIEIDVDACPSLAPTPAKKMPVEKEDLSIEDKQSSIKPEESKPGASVDDDDTDNCKVTATDAAASANNDVEGKKPANPVLDAKMREAFGSDSDDSDGEDVDDDVTVKQENKQKTPIEKKKILPKSKLAHLAQSDSSDDDDDDQDMLARFQAKKKAEKEAEAKRESEGKSKSLSY